MNEEKSAKEGVVGKEWMGWRSCREEAPQASESIGDTLAQVNSVPEASGFACKEDHHQKLKIFVFKYP